MLFEKISSSFVEVIYFLSIENILAIFELNWYLLTVLLFRANNLCHKLLFLTIVSKWIKTCVNINTSRWKSKERNFGTLRKVKNVQNKIFDAFYKNVWQKQLIFQVIRSLQSRYKYLLQKFHCFELFIAIFVYNRIPYVNTKRFRRKMLP